MRKSILLIASFILIMNVTFATTRTLSNETVGGAQYSTLLAAYNACVNGDTLLIEGTNNYYTMDLGCAPNGWGKNLVVIGSGFNTQKNTPGFKPTYIYYNSTCTNTFHWTSAGNGSRFYGIYFVGWTYAQTAISNYYFEDCAFGRFSMYNFNATNITFKNCFFPNDNDENLYFSNPASPFFATSTGIVVSNCVFDGFINGVSGDNSGVLIDHCIFLSTGVAPFQNLINAQIKNSIVMNMASVQGGTSSGNLYMNNICRLGSFPSGTGNLNTTVPLFTTYSLGTMWANTYDFHLQAGSPGLTGSSDGTQIGVHGGASTTFSEKGEPLIVPIMRTLIINNSTINANGTLNVQINASKPNDN